MISVNKCRNVVLFLLEKNNRGFLQPQALDAFFDLAQMDIFENLFFQYNKWLINESRHLSNTEFADIPKNIKEQIDNFSEYSIPSNFTYDVTDDNWTYSGTDVLYRTEGLSLVNSSGRKVDIEEVSKGTAWNNMINSKINAPTLTFPIYTKIKSGYRVAPKAPAGYSVELFYIRRPKAPKWTYVEDGNGNPIFNAGALDRQDIELSEDLFYPFIMKVMSFCGLQLQENQVIEAAANAEVVIDSKQS